MFFIKPPGVFVAKSIKVFLTCCCAVVLLFGCSSSSTTDSGLATKVDPVPLSCIAVLPAYTSVVKDETIDYEKAQALETGAAFATDVMQQQLEGKPRVRIVSAHQLDAYGPEIRGGISGTVAALGQNLDCDGVLLTTVLQYRQRQGTEYSVDAPAAVDFSMVLRRSTDGNILWSADFREEQQSVLSNILTFSKAKSRDFKWVKVEQLMEEGIKDRLAACPYLQ